MFDVNLLTLFCRTDFKLFSKIENEFFEKGMRMEKDEIKKNINELRKYKKRCKDEHSKIPYGFNRRIDGLKKALITLQDGKNKN